MYGPVVLWLSGCPAIETSSVPRIETTKQHFCLTVGLVSWDMAMHSLDAVLYLA